MTKKKEKIKDWVLHIYWHYYLILLLPHIATWFYLFSKYTIIVLFKVHCTQHVIRINCNSNCPDTCSLELCSVFTWHIAYLLQTKLLFLFLFSLFYLFFCYFLFYLLLRLRNFSFIARTAKIREPIGQLGNSSKLTWALTCCTVSLTVLLSLPLPSPLPLPFSLPLTVPCLSSLALWLMWPKVNEASGKQRKKSSIWNWNKVTEQRSKSSEWRGKKV